MKRPSFFLGHFGYPGGCACPQVGNDTPIIPPTGAVLSDNRYFTLTQAAAGQMLVVPKGSNVQSFLTAGVGVRGFAFYAAGEFTVEPAPALTLPLLNPLVSGSHPAPPGFKYIMAGTGDPADWRHVAAPTAGTWVLQSQNGSFLLVDASSIPGIDVIGASGVTTIKGGLMMLINLTPTTYALRRLAVSHNRVVVGDIDPVSGESGYKALPDASPLTHPIASFLNLRVREFIGLDGSGNMIAGGLEDAAVTGLGAVTDGKSVFYSTVNKRFFFRPPQTFNFTQNTTTSASTAYTSTFAAMPAGHGDGQSLNYNYPKVRIDFSMSTTAQESITLGLYRDGTLLQEFPFKTDYDVSFFYVDVANPLGAHTYDVRWRATTGVTATSPGIIEQSSFMIQTLGY